MNSQLLTVFPHRNVAVADCLRFVKASAMAKENEFALRLFEPLLVVNVAVGIG